MIQENAPVKYLFYEDISRKERMELPPLKARQIMSSDYGEEASLSLMALNLFGKGSDLPAQMALILSKIGRRYGAEDVLTTTIRHDFSANYLEYQWHRDGQSALKNVGQYTQEEWELFQKWLGKGQIHSFTVEESADAVIRKFLNIRKGSRELCFRYMTMAAMPGMCVLQGLPLKLSRMARCASG